MHNPLNPNCFKNMCNEHDHTCTCDARIIVVHAMTSDQLRKVAARIAAENLVHERIRRNALNN